MTASVCYFARDFHLDADPFKATRGNKPRQEAAAHHHRARTPNSETKPSDSDNDGIPDFAELRTFEDRESFRRWFTAIAETQFYQLSEQWKHEQRDCAGLVRFAMREALRSHDRAWFQQMGPAYEAVAPDVRGFNLDT